MYRDHVDALAARVDSLEAQLEVEHRRRLAAEAEAEAARAVTREYAVRGVTLRGDVDTPLPPMRPLLWPLVFIMALSALASLALSLRPIQRTHRLGGVSSLHRRARITTVCPYMERVRRQRWLHQRPITLPMNSPPAGPSAAD